MVVGEVVNILVSWEPPAPIKQAFYGLEQPLVYEWTFIMIEYRANHLRSANSLIIRLT